MNLSSFLIFCLPGTESPVLSSSSFTPNQQLNISQQTNRGLGKGGSSWETAGTSASCCYVPALLQARGIKGQQGPHVLQVRSHLRLDREKKDSQEQQRIKWSQMNTNNKNPFHKSEPLYSMYMYSPMFVSYTHTHAYALTYMLNMFPKISFYFSHLNPLTQNKSKFHESSRPTTRPIWWN